jgi:hypothetical protein
MSTSTRSAYPTLQEIEEARANHSYIRVTGKKNKNISIAGIYRTFENPATSNYVYVPSLRLMGDPEDVRKAILSLRWMGANGEVMSYSPQEADAFVATGLNKNNYNINNAYVPDDQGGMEDTLIREIEESSEARKGIKKEKSASKLPPVSLENLKDVWEQVTGKVETTATKASPSSSGRRRRQTLAERYRALAPGRVLDVSSFNPVTGTGAAAKPAPPSTSSKVGVPGIPIVSNNPATYEAAVNEIFGPQEGARLTEQYNRIALQGRRRQRASPVRQAAPALPTLPGQQVAPTNQRAAPIPPITQQVPLIPPTQVPIQAPRTSPRQNPPPLSEQTIPVRPRLANLPRLTNTANLNIPSNRKRPVFSSPEE